MTSKERRAYNEKLNEHIIYSGWDYLSKEETSELKHDITERAKYCGHTKIGNGKATYYKGDKGIVLRSYYTDVCRINRKRFYKTWVGYSATTLNHINEFLYIHGYKPISKREWIEMPYNKGIKLEPNTLGSLLKQL